MLSEEEYRRLREDHEVAYFRADLALSDPEGYSLEEKAEIIEGMRSSTEEVERAMREDFESMPPEMRRRMFEMLASSGPGARGFVFARIKIDTSLGGNPTFRWRTCRPPRSANLVVADSIRPRRPE
ncbi:hypothetical protein, partial [Gordonibacter urolithinfaciens]|uniref:hypothetical protein n=1 Tax=Gordonibacter urolithinfaciens TaxID=1335613 RepID=UPI001AA1C628